MTGLGIIFAVLLISWTSIIEREAENILDYPQGTSTVWTIISLGLGVAALGCGIAGAF